MEGRIRGEKGKLKKKKVIKNQKHHMLKEKKKVIDGNRAINSGPSFSFPSTSHDLKGGEN